jgi:hypothetical protein
MAQPWASKETTQPGLSGGGMPSQVVPHDPVLASEWPAKPPYVMQQSGCGDGVQQPGKGCVQSEPSTVSRRSLTPRSQPSVQVADP